MNAAVPPVEPISEAGDLPATHDEMSEMSSTEEASAEPTAILVDKSIGEKEYFDHVRKINDTFYDQIRIADQKAAYIFTFMLAFLISSVEGRGVFKIERYAGGEILTVISSGLMAAAVVFTLVCAILVVLPRVRTTATSLFWGVWAREHDKLAQAHARLDQDYLFKEYIDNATNLSKIAQAKYRLVGLAFRGLIVAVLGYVLILILA